MNDQVLDEPELVTGASFDRQSDPRVPTDVADLAVLGQVPGHDFVTVEADPNDRDLRTPVGFDGDQVGQPRTVKHGADGIGNLHGAENVSAPRTTGPARFRDRVVGGRHPAATTCLRGTTISSAM